MYAATLDDEAPSDGAPRFLPGQRIARFVLVRPAGIGGMGVIFEARDTALDRRVALKLLRADATRDPAAARQRMLRESRALARLNHPNVVTLYDVGVHGGELYLAMEFVEGDTLGTWMTSPRELREILDVFVAAARGLHAAHEVGLVHRDVKPANILIGHDERVRVSDFGVVRDERHEPGRRATPARSGRVVGTPSYMAPEVRAGEVATARSDQWSLAASLRDVLGARAVPRWLRRVIDRGLAEDPRDRYASIEAMARALRAHRRRQIAVASAIAASALIGGAIAVTLASTQAPVADPCAEIAETAAATWNQHRRASLISTFARGGTGGSDLGAIAVRAIDHRVDEWRRARSGVCELANRHGREGGLLTARRIDCLDRHLVRLDTTIAALRTAKPDQLVRATDVALEIPAADICDDVAQLERLEQLPDDIPRRRALRATFAELDTAAARFWISQEPATLEVARRAVDTAGSYAPLRARALQLVAVAQRHAFDPAAIETLQRAFAAAIESGDDLLQAELAVSMIEAATIRPVEASERARRVADADARIRALARHAPRRASQLRFHWLGATANADLAADERLAAVDGFRRAVVLGDELFGANTVGQARVRQNLGVALFMTGEARAAIAQFEASMPVLERLLPANHPELIAARFGAAGAYHFAGDDGRARALVAQVLAAPAVPPVLQQGARELAANIAMAAGDWATGRAELDAVRTLARATRRDDPSLEIRAACARTAERARTPAQALAAVTCFGDARRPQIAVPIAEAALAKRHGVDRTAVELRFALARQLAARGHDWDALRASVEAMRARAEAGKLRDARALAAMIDAWAAR